MHALGFSPRAQARRLDAKAAPRGRAKQGQHCIHVEIFMHSCSFTGSSRARLPLGRHTAAAAGPSDPGVGDSKGDLGREAGTPENSAEGEEHAPKKEMVEGGGNDGDDETTADMGAQEEKGKDKPEELNANAYIEEHKAEDGMDVSPCSIHATSARNAWLINRIPSA
jgi:hypothetical protein